MKWGSDQGAAETVMEEAAGAQVGGLETGTVTNAALTTSPAETAATSAGLQGVLAGPGAMAGVAMEGVEAMEEEDIETR